MHTHLAEVISEARLEESEHRGVERPPWGAQHLSHNGGGFAGGDFGPSDPQGFRRRRMCAADLRWRANEAWVGQAHHLVGDAVRLMLESIVNRSDKELRLNISWEWRRGERG